MRTAIFYFLICLSPFSAAGQPVKSNKVLTVEATAEQTVLANEIYYSITSLAETHHQLRSLDSLYPFGTDDTLGYISASALPRNADPLFPTSACASADSVLRSWLSLYGPAIEVVEQELYDEIGIYTAPSDRYLLKIKSVETFKSLQARLEKCRCFIGELVEANYSHPETLEHTLTLTALREAKQNAGEMLRQLDSKIKSVYHIDPAKVIWGDPSLASADDWYPFDPQPNRALELRCRVEVTVQFLFK